MENTILDMVDDRVVCSIGGKGTAKSTLLLNYIKKNYHLYDMIFLFLPAFSNETDKKYDFMNKYPNIFIQTGLLTETFINFVHESSQHGKRTFFGLDDATGYGDIISSSNTLKQMITTSRHIKTTIWLCIHASKKILVPAFRSNIDYLFVHHLSNQKLSDDIYTEFFSKKINKKDYDTMMNRKDVWTLTCIDLIHKEAEIDFDVAKWKLMTDDLPDPKIISKERLNALPAGVKRYIPKNLAQTQEKKTTHTTSSIPKRSSVFKIPKIISQ
jgi:hypothetical protein